MFGPSLRSWGKHTHTHTHTQKKGLVKLNSNVNETGNKNKAIKGLEGLVPSCSEAWSKKKKVKG